MRFTEYPSKAWEEILPGVQGEERDLVSKLVAYESADRLTAEEVCHIDFTRSHAILIRVYRHCSTLISMRHENWLFSSGTTRYLTVLPLTSPPIQKERHEYE